MNELQVFEEREVLGKDFKIYGTIEEPLFLAKDVASWIEHSRASEMLKGIDDEEKLMQTILASGQKREMWFLTEDGLYEVLMQSRKLIAKQFKKEVKEILKTIRKHGAYMTESTLEKAITSPDFLIRLAEELKKEQNKRKELEIEKEANKPKVIFAESVQASKQSILVGELAKLLKQNGIEIGQNRLFEWLRNQGYLISRKGESFNLPTQKSMNMQLMEIKESTHVNPDGSVRLTRTTKVTGKGQIYFINKFRK